MTSHRTATLLAVSLACTGVVGCGGDDEPTTSGTSTGTTAKSVSTAATGTTTSTTTPPRPATSEDVKADKKVSPEDIEMIDYAVRRITLECAQRRKSKDPVGRPSSVFRSQIGVLIAQHADTPRVQFTLPKATTPTTVRAVLVRFGQSLALPAPDGCGASSTSGLGTAGTSLRIRKALGG